MMFETTARYTNEKKNVLLLYCYGGLRQHNHTGNPITVATSGHTNVRENNGERRGGGAIKYMSRNNGDAELYRCSLFMNGR
jgi:hypothetical protein